MLRGFGLKRNVYCGWLCAASFLLFLIFSGCVISPRRLPGDIVPGTSPTPTPNPSATPTPTPSGTPQGKLYVSNSGDNSILRFDQALTASGNIPPAVTIKGPNSKLNTPNYIFLDVAADRLYVVNNGDLSILVFDNISTKSGDVPPERVIGGVNSTIAAPTDVFVDTTRNLLYVADDLQIEVFASAATANGDPPPTRSYSFSFSVTAIFVDTVNDRLFAADSGGNAINVYDNISTTASGPLPASRTIQGANTHLATPSGIAIDAAGRLVVSNTAGVAPAQPSITIYSNAATATANQAPSAEIVGSNTGFGAADQIVVDTTGTGTLYSADSSVARVAIYGNLNADTGNIAPTRTISGPATTLTPAGRPIGIALDKTR